MDRGKELREKTGHLKQLQEIENRHNSKEIKRTQQEIEMVLEKEDLKWRKRPKRNWYQLGDRNTKFFHSCANQRRSKNRIRMVMDEQNRSYLRHDELEVAFSEFFVRLFTSSKPSQYDMDDCLKNMEA